MRDPHGPADQPVGDARVKVWTFTRKTHTKQHSLRLINRQLIIVECQTALSVSERERERMLEMDRRRKRPQESKRYKQMAREQE